jgi:hypothetical protein
MWPQQSMQGAKLQMKAAEADVMQLKPCDGYANVSVKRAL